VPPRVEIVVIGRLLREPLLQFLVLGFALFAAYHGLRRGADAAVTKSRIEFTQDDLRQIGLAWVAQGRPAPSPEEMRNLVDARVRE